MKKISLLLIAILIGIYAGLSFMGAGSDYAAEKAYYEAMKLSRDIAANPDVLPPGLIKQVEAKLVGVVNKYSKTEVARMSHMSLAELYIFTKRYDDAIGKLNEILKLYPKSPETSSTASFLKGRVYELQKNWPRALKEYESVRDNYTNTEVGLQVPLYIAKYYADHNRDADAKQAYLDAADFYEKIQDNNSSLVLGYIASTLRIQSYMILQDYSNAGKALEDTIDAYMSPIALRQLLPLVEVIYVDKMKSPRRAIELYEKVLSKVKDVKLTEILSKRIELIRNPKK